MTDPPAIPAALPDVLSEGVGHLAVPSKELTAEAEGDDVTGRYFVGRQPKSSHRSSYDSKTTARLWQVSADLVGLAVDPAH